MFKENWHYNFENFEKAFLSLKKSINRVENNLDDDLLLAGFIQTYEFTLELAWKTVKKYLENQGFSTLKSPKETMRMAYQQELIEDGETWLSALLDRNITVHTYNKDIAKKIASTILKKYFKIMEKLYIKLKEIKENE